MASIGDFFARLGLDSTEFAKGLNDSQRSAEAFGNKWEEVVKGATDTFSAFAGAFAFAEFGKEAIAAADTFKQAMNAIRIGTGETGEALKSLGESFSKVFTSVPNEATEVSKALSELHTRLQLTGEPLENLTTRFLELARITGQSVTPLIQESEKAFAAWKISTEDQSAALDLMLTAAQRSGTTIGELAQTVKQFAPALQQMGFGFEESVALIAKFEKEGLNTEQVLAGLSTALRKMAKEGITDTSTAFSEITERIKGAGSAGAANAVAVDLFGKSVVGLSDAVRKGGFDLQAMVKDLKEHGDTIQKAAADTKTFGQSWEIFKHQVEEALIPLGQVLKQAFPAILEVVRPLITIIAELGRGFVALPPGIKEAVVALAAIASGGALLVPLLEKIASATGIASESIVGLSRIATLGAAAFAGWEFGKFIAGSLATSNLESAAAKLNAVLLDQGVVIERGSLTITEWTAKLLEAADKIKLLSPAVVETGEALKKLKEGGDQWISTATGIIGAAAGVAQLFAGPLKAAIASITVALSTGMVAALLPFEAALLAVGVAAGLAAYAFAVWKVGEWAYSNVPGVKELTNALVNLFGLDKAAERMGEASGKIGLANIDLAVSVEKLEAALAKQGVAIERGDMSLMEYSKALRQAAVDAGLMGSSTVSTVNTISELFKKLGITTLESVQKQRDEITKAIAAWKALSDEQKRSSGISAGDIDLLTAKLKAMGDTASTVAVRGIRNLAAIISQTVSVSKEQIIEFVKDAEKALADFDKTGILKGAGNLDAEELRNVVEAIKKVQSEWESATKPVQFNIKSITENVKDLKKEILAASAAFAGIAAPEVAGHINTVAEATALLNQEWELAMQAVDAMTEAQGKNAESAISMGAIQQAVLKGLDVTLESTYQKQRKQYMDLIDLLYQWWVKLNDAQKAASGLSEVDFNKMLDGVDKIGEHTNKATTAVSEHEKAWKKFASQVSTVVNDFAKKVVDNFAKIFDTTSNDKLDADAAALRTSLDERAAGWATYQQEASDKIAQITADHAASLAKQTADLQDGLVDHIAAYDSYVSNAAEKFAETTKSNAAQLAQQLADLQKSLRDRTESYADYVAGANKSLQRIGQDLSEKLSDAQKSANQKIQDETISHNRKIQDLNADLQAALKKGDEARAADIRLSLQRENEDHARAMARIRADLAETVDDAKRQAARQTQDQQDELAIRKRDQEEFLADLKVKQAAEVADAAARQAKDTAEYEKGLADKQKDLEQYKVETAQKLKDLQAANKAEVDKEVADVRKAMADKQAEYDKFVAATNAKLKELEEQHKGVWTRIKDAALSSFEELGKGILRLMVEQAFKPLAAELDKILLKAIKWGEDVIEKVFKKLLSHIVDVFEPAATKSIGNVLGTIPGGDTATGGLSDPFKIPGIGGQGTAGAPSGSAGAVLSSAGKAGITSLVGAVSGVITAVSSVIGNFQMAGMNKSLDILVSLDLGILNESLNLRRDAWDQHLALDDRLNGMQETLWGKFEILFGILRGGIGVRSTPGDPLPAAAAKIADAADDLNASVRDFGGFVEDLGGAMLAAAPTPARSRSVAPSGTSAPAFTIPARARTGASPEPIEATGGATVLPPAQPLVTLGDVIAALGTAADRIVEAIQGVAERVAAIFVPSGPSDRQRALASGLDPENVAQMFGDVTEDATNKTVTGFSVSLAAVNFRGLFDGVTSAVTAQFSLLDDIRAGVYGVRSDVQAVGQQLQARSSAPLTIRFEGFNSRDEEFGRQIIAQFIREAKQAGGNIF